MGRSLHIQIATEPTADTVRCSALWRGYTATFRLNDAGELTLVSYRYPISLAKEKTEAANEKLSGDFWLVLKPTFSAPRTYVPFKDGRIVEDESKWVEEERDVWHDSERESHGRTKR